MKTKPYEKYKEIELPWLERIPSHWDQIRNKNLLVIKDDRVGLEHGEYTLLSLTKKGIIKRDMENPQGKFPKEFDTYKIVSKNDIIFCLFDIDETPRTLGLSEFEGMITGAYDIFSIENINRRYYYYYYLNLDNFKMMKPLYTGLRKTININRFMRLLTPLPPKEEQDKIVAFLDNKLEKIDKFIDLKARQIELLKEQKEAMINKAVTKGLDDNVKMKDSGIKYIKEIPKNWKIIKLKYLFKIINGATPKSGVMDYWDGGINWITPKDLSKTNQYISDSERTITNEGYNSCSTSMILKGNIIMATRAPIGSIRINKIDLCTNQGCKGLIANKQKINTLYSYFLLNTYLEEIRVLGKGTTFPELSITELSNFKVPVPNKKQQEEIMSYLENESKLIDETIDLYKEEIDLIKEYKTSLISSVVTGKIDIREV